MGRAFVIRPFGIKTDGSGQSIDFEAVHNKLIKPALEANGLAGDTTGEIVESGNIREDMFQLILEADVVVCDITINNANVFYELGIRHALRKKRTLLIKGVPSNDTTPFDLLTDRYLAYPAKEPEQKGGALAEVIRASLASDRPTDSPIFQMVPGLAEADAERLHVVPPDLVEEVGRAASAGAKGWLRLLAEEIRGLRFERSGLKLVGRAQWEVKDYEAACVSWERAREMYPDDVAANLALANIYERQSRGGNAELLVRSDQALERVIRNPTATTKDIAEALALKGRNQKTHWRSGFQKAADVSGARQAALSRSLIDSYESYRRAFSQDLNHFYPGLSALQMGSVLLDLSGESGWNDMFSDDREAESYRRDLEATVTELRSAVVLSVKAALARLDKADPDYIWGRISECDLLFLTSDSDKRVVMAYTDALSGRSAFHWDAAKGQLELYAALGFKVDRARAVIQAVEKGLPESKPAEAVRQTHVVIFAGHQVDRPGRSPPRFPADREARVRELIAAGMKAIRDEGADVIGLGSASPGADIVWHETCKDLGVTSVVCLPMPAKDHVKVVFAGYDDAWRSRFLDLVEDRGRQGRVLTLSDQPGLPKWLPPANIDPWARGNAWVMELARTWAADRISLLAFWDGQEEGQAAGTAQVVRLARDAGNVRIKVIDARQILP
jgi:tetratricopeptide (TPR) repeat protein